MKRKHENIRVLQNGEDSNDFSGENSMKSCLIQSPVAVSHSQQLTKL